MKDQWTLILKDGSRHEVTVIFRFQPIGGTKVPTGAIDGDPFVMHRAFREGGAALETSDGEQYPIIITEVGSDWAFRGETEQSS